MLWNASSGSVIGPLIVSELLRRGIPVLCIVIGSTTSAIETDNSIKTLQTLQSLASSGKTGGRAIPFLYFKNCKAKGETKQEYMGNRVEIDMRVEETIRKLAMLFNGMHRELDRTDLTNWLDYSKVAPDIRPQLIEIMIFKDAEEGAKDKYKPLDSYRGLVIGSASILNRDDDEVPELDQPYSCVGYISERTSEFVEIPNHNFITTACRIPSIFRGLSEIAGVYKASKDELMGAELSGIGFGNENDAGIIL